MNGPKQGDAALVDEHVRVLFHGSDAIPDRPLDLDREAAAIKTELEAHGLAGALPLRADLDGNTAMLQEALLRAPRAQVLHLSAHGHPTKGMMMFDPEGRRVPVTGDELAELLKPHRNIRLVVLSACHQTKAARQLQSLVDCVIGTSAAVKTDSNRVFMCAFYKALAHGESVGEAFDAAARMSQINKARSAKAIFLAHRRAVDPRYVRLDPISGARVTPDEFLVARRRLAQVVNPHDDLVIWCNVPEWRQIVPHSPGSAPADIEIPTPSGPWQRDDPPDRATWETVAQHIRAIGAAVQASSHTRIHVVVKMPYSLQALLARSIEAMNRETIFYQESPPGQGEAADKRTWQPWGPGAAEFMPPVRQTPVFNAANPPRHPSRETCEVAIAVEVSRPIDPELIHRALGVPRHAVKLYHLIPQAGASQVAITAATVGRAASQLDDLLQSVAGWYPRARGIHLFIAAPAALVARGVMKVNNSPIPVYIHEFFASAQGGARYRRMLDLTRGEVVYTPDASPSDTGSLR